MGALHPIDESPFGMGIYPSHRTSGEETVRAASLARDIGIRWTRDEIGWAPLQPEPGTWRWDQFDHGIETMLDHGISVMGLLGYTAPWAATSETSDGKPDTLSVPDLNAWRDYVSAVVERYRDKIHVWQIWNEPNNFWSPRPNPDDYARVLIAGAESARAADPACWTVGCNTSLVDLEFDRAVFNAGGWEHADIIGVHPYRYPHTPEHSDMLGDLLELAALSAEFGAVKPLWITEIGYATHYGPGGSSEWWSGAMLMRLYLTAWASGLVQKLFWYDYRDDGLDKTENEHNFGILRNDWTPKMAYEGLGVMAGALEGFAPDGRVDLGRNVIAYRFRRGEETRYAVWSTGLNIRRPVPAPSEQVRVLKPWEQDVARCVPDAEPGARSFAVARHWLTMNLDATPAFVIPA